MAINPIYTITAPGVSFIQNKCCLGIFNGVGSGKVIRLYRATILNNQTVAVTGIANLFSLQRFTTGSGGIAVVPVKHDTTASSLPAQIITSTNMNFTPEVTLRSIGWSSDEPIASDSSNIDEFQTVPSLNIVWDCSQSYINEAIEPLVLREGYGAGLVLTSAASASIVGSADFAFEFTVGTT